MCRLDATTLVHCNVDDHCTVGNLLQHASGDEFWRGGTGYKNGANNQIGLRDRIVDHVSAGSECWDLRKENIVEFAQSIEIVIDDRDVRTHSDRDLRGVCAYHTATNDHDSCCRHTRNTTQQDSTSTTHFLEIVRTDLDRHASRNFRHRRQQRQGPATIGDRFVSDAGDLAIE